MKKLFTLVAMAFMAIGANAQAVIAEVDWTQKTEWDGGWFSTDYAEVSVEQGVGAIINCTSDGTTNYWEPQVPMINGIAEIAEGGQYQVKFQFTSPKAGELRLDFYSWAEGENASMAQVFDVEEGDNDMTIDFLDYPTGTHNAGIFYQCGKLPGKHILKTVQVIDLEAGGGETGPAVIAEVDWTQKTEWDGGWFSTDYAEVSVEQGVGAIINCTSDGTTNYWEPQVPMINGIPEIAEGGQYQVKFQFTSPKAGELRLDFYSWAEGENASMAQVFEVEEGDNDMTIDFLDYPTGTHNAGIFYQCGKLPGKHIIKKVTVIDLEGGPDAIKTVKTAAAKAGIRYNLAGQKVDANYKGVVIMNGKKFMQNN